MERRIKGSERVGLHAQLFGWPVSLILKYPDVRAGRKKGGEEGGGACCAVARPEWPYIEAVAAIYRGSCSHI